MDTLRNQIMAFALIGLGVRSLSVAGRAVPSVKRIVRGVSVAVAAIMLAPGISMAQSKQRVYDASGRFVGTIEQLPGGSQKLGLYDAQGVRTGTVEPGWPGSNKTVIVGPNGTVERTIVPSSSDVFPGDGADPFAADDSDD